VLNIRNTALRGSGGIASASSRSVRQLGRSYEDEDELHAPLRMMDHGVFCGDGLTVITALLLRFAISRRRQRTGKLDAMNIGDRLRHLLLLFAGNPDRNFLRILFARAFDILRTLLQDACH